MRSTLPREWDLDIDIGVSRYIDIKSTSRSSAFQGTCFTQLLHRVCVQLLPTLVMAFHNIAQFLAFSEHGRSCAITCEHRRTFLRENNFAPLSMKSHIPTCPRMPLRALPARLACAHPRADRTWVPAARPPLSRPKALPFACPQSALRVCGSGRKDGLSGQTKGCGFLAALDDTPLEDGDLFYGNMSTPDGTSKQVE